LNSWQSSLQSIPKLQCKGLQSEGHDEEVAELFAYARETVHQVAGLRRYGALNGALHILRTQVRCFQASAGA
jgi:hypothetical protein